jgi:hypothetical protein
MKGTTIYYINGKAKYALTHQPIKDMMHYDGHGNPRVWFIKDLETGDYPVCGVLTKREALQFVGIRSI